MNAEEWYCEHGPAAAADAEFEPMTLTLRKAGMRRLYPIKQNSNSSGSSVGHTRAVYYLPDEHSKKDVLREFFRVNPRWRRLEPTHISNRLPPEFRDAYRSLRHAGEVKTDE